MKLFAFILTACISIPLLPALLSLSAAIAGVIAVLAIIYIIGVAIYVRLPAQAKRQALQDEYTALLTSVEPSNLNQRIKRNLRIKQLATELGHN